MIFQIFRSGNLILELFCERMNHPGGNYLMKYLFVIHPPIPHQGSFPYEIFWQYKNSPFVRDNEHIRSAGQNTLDTILGYVTSFAEDFCDIQIEFK